MRPATVRARLISATPVKTSRLKRWGKNKAATFNTLRLWLWTKKANACYLTIPLTSTVTRRSG